MQALVVTVPASEAELAADALWALGVLAVEERVVDGEGAAPATEDDFVELWTSLGDDPQAVMHAAEGFPARWRWHAETVDDSVADTWRRHAVPSWITNDLVVVPAWLDDPTTEEGVEHIRIDPAASFGLGDHPTTVLTARALRAAIYPGATVLDVGSGSGVLSVIAARSGAGYVEAVDVSPAAREATAANAARNGVESVIRVRSDDLADIEGDFDVVVANILAPTLIALAPDLRRLTSASGVLVVSGLLAGASDHVVEALAPLRVVERLEREGWTAIVLRH